MGWLSEEFGSSHEGQAGAVLADGTEPPPVVFDTGSGSSFHESTDWWVYDGTLRRPLAAAVRGSCSCGWRGTAAYFLDWTQVDTDSVYEPYLDLPGPKADWDQHIAEVEARSVPMPAELSGLLQQVRERLDALTDEAPLAALRAVRILERTTKRVGREAAYRAEADDVSPEVLGQALGLTGSEARSHLVHFALRH
ncbi:hypothetical protein AB0I68_31265 [Streptomyces sp. NPDC050448]|uniref:hypothetical protein n=1 Tax=Streptomyces sp. NPDC050448 TaxID=3155404 RepID=UPI00341CDE4D